MKHWNEELNKIIQKLRKTERQGTVMDAGSAFDVNSEAGHSFQNTAHECLSNSKTLDIRCRAVPYSIVYMFKARNVERYMA